MNKKTSTDDDEDEECQVTSSNCLIELLSFERYYCELKSHLKLFTAIFPDSSDSAS
jgi:hypothetical protein